MTHLIYTDLLALWHDFRRNAVKVKPNPAAVAYSYVRFSTPAQEEGDSLRRQIALRDAWLAKNPSILLDRSVAMEDRGVGAFKGKHRKNPKHALCQFLDLVERRDVKPGSFLIVENLDRLTRENPVDSIPAVLSLVKAGIRVVQLEPETVYDSTMDQLKMLTLLMGLYRAHDESKRKSGAVAQAMGEKRERARAGKPHGRRTPAWIKTEGGRYTLDPEKTAVVRLIFQWCIDGLGSTQIVHRLTVEGIPPIFHRPHWCKASVADLLSRRAAVGDYVQTPGAGEGGGEVEVIPGYYPAAVSEATFAKAQAAIAARAKRSGRPVKEDRAANPFSGLLRAAHDGSKLRLGHNHGRSFFKPASYIDGYGEKGTGVFPAAHLTDGVLSQLREVAAADLFRDPAADQVQEIEGKLLACDKRLANAMALWDAEPDSVVWGEKVNVIGREKKALLRAREEAAQAALCPLTGAWTEAVAQMQANDPARLRQCLLHVVDSIWCLFVRRGLYRVAAVQVCFKGGDVRRDYLIWSYVPRSWLTRTERDCWQSLSVAGGFDGGFDLRNPEDAAALAEVLKQADPVDPR